MIVNNEEFLGIRVYVLEFKIKLTSYRERRKIGFTRRNLGGEVETERLLRAYAFVRKTSSVSCMVHGMDRVAILVLSLSRMPWSWCKHMLSPSFSLTNCIN